MNLQNFEQYLKLNIDTQNTRTNYLSRLKVFFESFYEFNQETVNSFLEQLVDNEASKSTYNGYIYALKTYAKFIEVELKFPKAKYISKKKHHVFITEEEMNDEILSYFNRIFDTHVEKNKTIVKTLFYTGLRPIELCNLKSQDIDFEKNLFIVKNPKDKDDRVVPFPKKIKSDIQSIVNERGFDANYQQILYIFQTINEKLRYKKVLNPYCLRHSFAEWCLEKGLPIERLQLLMGHSDIQTTLIYAKPNQEQAIKSYKEILDK